MVHTSACFFVFEENLWRVHLEEWAPLQSQSSYTYKSACGLLSKMHKTPRDWLDSLLVTLIGVTWPSASEYMPKALALQKVLAWKIWKLSMTLTRLRKCFKHARQLNEPIRYFTLSAPLRTRVHPSYYIQSPPRICLDCGFEKQVQLSLGLDEPSQCWWGASYYVFKI